MFRQFLTFAGLLTALAICAGCSSDDNGGTNPPPVTSVRVVVAELATSPSLTSATDPVWNGVTPTQIDISEPDALVSSITSTSDSVKIQVAHRSDSLWIRLQWQDNTHSIWRASYQVIDTAYPSGSSTIVRLSSERDYNFEDQVLVAFAGLGPNLWDVWNWRSLTTGAGRLAQGMKLLKDTSGTGPDTLALTSDTIPTNLVVASSNYSSVDFPFNMHKDSSDFSEPVMYDVDVVPFRAMSRGWEVGQKVPGFYIDTSIYGRIPTVRGSRWDIRAASTYDAGTYTLMMVAPMNTGYDDDINFLTKDSIQVQVGLLDNALYEKGGSSKKGFTKKFWLIF